MEKRRPSWKDYILAVILAVALLYAIFPIKGLLKLMTALYWRYILYGLHPLPCIPAVQNLKPAKNP